MHKMPHSKAKFSHIVITGASSGIGAALAARYAAPETRLSLQGRNAERLRKVADACRAKGATVDEKIIDVQDQDAMEAWLTAIDATHPVDLLIANAGISAGMGGEGENPQQIRQLFDINVQGVMNAAQPILPRMLARKSGHIALMSSLAGFRGWPGAPAYGASKAAIRIYGEGMRGALCDSGVKIHVICPGFVKTPMTNGNRFPMPFIITPERAAEIIVRGIAQNKGRIAFPAIPYFMVWLCATLPDSLGGWLVLHLPQVPLDVFARARADGHQQRVARAGGAVHAAARGAQRH